MIIRQATLLDLLLLAPLFSLYEEEARGHDNFPVDLEEGLKNLALTITDKKGCLLLAITNEEVVGVLWGHARSLPWSKAVLAYDTILYVKPSKRKTSAGYKLMKEWELWAESVGATEVQISIASGIHEKQSISFFEKLGYSYIGQQLRKQI